MFEEKFFTLCNKAASQLEFLGTEADSHKKFNTFTILRRMIKLELVLKRNSLGGVNNVLYCRVYPNKSAELFYLLPEIFVELDIPEYRSTFFSMIENEERLEACFNALWAIITEHLHQIEAGAENGLLPWARTVSEDDIWERRLMFPEAAAIPREPIVINYYTSDAAYQALLKGNNEKAIKLIERQRAKGNSLEYRNRLSDFLKEHPDFSPMPDECNALKDAMDAHKKGFPAAALMFLAVFAAFSAVFLAGMLIFNAVFRSGTVAYFGAPWYCAFLLAATPAMFGAVFFRRRLMKLLFPKRSKAMIERDTAENGTLTDKLAGGAFFAALGFAIAVFFMMCLPAVRVYEDRLDHADEGNVLSRETCRFEDIGEICHISARYNDYGDRIERPSYVLIMKDGRRFDLDCALTDKQAEEQLFPLLEKYSIPRSELDSDKELP